MLAMHRKKICYAGILAAFILASVVLLRRDAWVFLKWYFFITLLGILAAPVADRVFGGFDDHGWLFSKVIGLLSRGQIESNPMLSHVNLSKCSGCGACVDICPYSALSLVEANLRENSKKVTRTVCQVNEGLCQGCGACAVACRSGALDLFGFSDEGVLQEVEMLCQ